mmetsp:Transcript_21566/g.59786  ORF Transcript_21566/g.59786 Transcript_21566/m.59786 type:complete len:227 (-) Transcript_21566:1185-1865(-)
MFEPAPWLPAAPPFALAGRELPSWVITASVAPPLSMLHFHLANTPSSTSFPKLSFWSSGTPVWPNDCAYSSAEKHPDGSSVMVSCPSRISHENQAGTARGSISAFSCASKLTLPKCCTGPPVNRSHSDTAPSAVWARMCRRSFSTLKSQIGGKPGVVQQGSGTAAVPRPWAASKEGRFRWLGTCTADTRRRLAGKTLVVELGVGTGGLVGSGHWLTLEDADATHSV